MSFQGVAHIERWQTCRSCARTTSAEKLEFAIISASGFSSVTLIVARNSDSSARNANHCKKWKLAMSNIVPDRQPDASALWTAFREYTRRLARSSEMRSVFCAALLIALTALLGPYSVLLIVIAIVLAFLVGTAFGPTILRDSRSQPDDTEPIAVRSRRRKKECKRDR
jgi:hypothetical protein